MNLYQKIIEISNELRVAKDGKNKGIGFNYFNADDIANKLNPLMKKHGVFIKFEIVLKKEFERDNIYTSLVTVFDTDTDKSIEYQFDIKEAVVQRAQGAQATGATITYAKRYMLMNIFNIADNKDDPDAHLGEEVEKPKQSAEVIDALKDLISDNQELTIPLVKIALATWKLEKVDDLSNEQAATLYKKLKEKIKNGTTSN